MEIFLDILWVHDIKSDQVSNPEDQPIFPRIVKISSQIKS